MIQRVPGYHLPSFLQLWPLAKLQCNTSIRILTLISSRHRTFLSPQWSLILSFCKYNLFFSIVVYSLNPLWFFVTPWTRVCRTLLSMVFPKQEYWSGLPLPSPGHLPDPGVEPVSPALEARSFPLSHQGSPHSRTESRESCRERNNLRLCTHTQRVRPGLECTAHKDGAPGGSPKFSILASLPLFS